MTTFIKLAATFGKSAVFDATLILWRVAWRLRSRAKTEAQVHLMVQECSCQVWFQSLESNWLWRFRTRKWSGSVWTKQVWMDPSVSRLQCLISKLPLDWTWVSGLLVNHWACEKDKVKELSVVAPRTRFPINKQKDGAKILSRCNSSTSR